MQNKNESQLSKRGKIGLVQFMGKEEKVMSRRIMILYSKCRST